MSLLISKEQIVDTMMKRSCNGNLMEMLLERLASLIIQRILFFIKKPKLKKIVLIWLVFFFF